MVYDDVAAGKTKNMIGISETLVSTSVAGIVFGLLAGQPLIIIGTTGPLLLFDESLFKVGYIVLVLVLVLVSL